MTLEQFKEKVKNYENTCAEDAYMKVLLAHEIAMNVMQVMRDVAEEGFKEGWQYKPSELQAWQDSDIKKRLEE